MERHRGLFTIPVTPFTDQGALDEASLRRLIAFCVEGGAHGIVTPVNASEFTTLSPAERATVTRIAVEETERAAGKRGEGGARIPVVIGVGAPTTAEAVRYARWAAEAGAAAVIAMPAYDPPLHEDGVYDFYAALADAVPLPIYIQNHEPIGAGPGPRPGTPLTPELLARMLREIESVRYVKEESANTGFKITRTLELAGDACWGIMGGKAGRYLLDEFRRGACGTMPACESTDVHAQLWNALDAGHQDAARHLFKELLPLLNYEAAFGTAVYKEVLYRRRIIASPYKRLPGLTLDAYDHQELDLILAELAPLFTVKTPTTRPS
ncbi:MAG TPA: dihydrodipicolinate synthase family protein [Chloroflexota bacterium]|nr:dihydrodipicolinate synthase family protein [Chloroflexota bacterium]